MQFCLARAYIQKTSVGSHAELLASTQAEEQRQHSLSWNQLELSRAMANTPQQRALFHTTLSACRHLLLLPRHEMQTCHLRQRWPSSAMWA